MGVKSAYVEQGATFSADRQFRYGLWRTWKKDALKGFKQGSFSHAGFVLWIMLNPSTADEHVLDPTLRRCEGYSLEWGFDGFVVCNLFAFRSTDPDVLLTTKRLGLDIIGPDNDATITKYGVRAARIVAGWGSLKYSGIEDRARIVERLLFECGRHMFCLGENLDRSPKHPLYLSKKRQLRSYATVL